MKKYFYNINKLFLNKIDLTRKSRHKGFTLVETLVAVFIFSLSILGLMVVLGNGITNTNYAKKKVIASYLAQEGIEYIRNMRDTFVLYDTDQLGWEDFLAKLAPCEAQQGSSGNAATKGCYLEDHDINFSDQDKPITKIDIIECQNYAQNIGTACPELSFHSTTGRYDNLPGSPSGFWRMINYYPDGIDGFEDNPDEIEVMTTVFWRQGSGTKSVSFSSNLFNWTKAQ